MVKFKDSKVNFWTGRCSFPTILMLFQVGEGLAHVPDEASLPMTHPFLVCFVAFSSKVYFSSYYIINLIHEMGFV